MTKHNRMPAVPPDQQNPKGGGQDPDENMDLRQKHRRDANNTEEAGQRANIRQNSSNQRSG